MTCEYYNTDTPLKGLDGSSVFGESIDYLDSLASFELKLGYLPMLLIILYPTTAASQCRLVAKILTWAKSLNLGNLKLGKVLKWPRVGEHTAIKCIFIFKRGQFLVLP